MSEREEWLNGLKVGDTVWLWRFSPYQSGRKLWVEARVCTARAKYVEVKADNASARVRRNCKWNNGHSDGAWYVVADQPVFERHLAAEWDLRDKLAPRLRALLGSLEHLPWERLLALGEMLDAMEKERSE